MNAAPPLRPLPPTWVVDQFDAASAGEEMAGASRVSVTSRRTEKFSLLSAQIDGALGLSASQLVEAVTTLYRSLTHELHRQKRHAIRIWNFVPDIQGCLDGGDRYMTFNMGRFAAYCDWFGGIDAFPSALPTASAVGVTTSELSVYALAADEPGCPIENPRQVPSYQYSRRYGIRPPCFSRATKLGSTLLIGGTASILGQHSLHEDDVDAQVVETCRNIGGLIRAAAPRSTEPSLQMLRSIRVHVLNPHHAAQVHALLNDLVPALANVEVVQAALCRRELLVEIEGVAELNNTSD